MPNDMLDSIPDQKQRDQAENIRTYIDCEVEQVMTQ
jgi:hypothetical protein